MTLRRWAAWLLVVAAALSLPAPGRSQADRPSHRPVGTALEEDLHPQETIQKRLRQLRSFQDPADEKAFQDNIQALARKLMNDKKFLESLEGTITREQAEQLLGKVGEGAGIGNDPKLQTLLRESLAGKGLTEQDKERLQHWREKLQQNGIREPSVARRPGGRPPAMDEAPPPQQQANPRPPQPLPGGRSSGPAPLENIDSRTPDWLARRLDRWVNGVDKWLDTPAGKSWRDAFADVARRSQEQLKNNPAWVERARGLSRYLPRVSDYLPRRPASRLSIPRMGSLPSMPSVRPSSAASTGKALACLAVLAVVLLAVWRVGSIYETVRRARGAVWRLGPWPVQPQAVSTRGELVRAFEHLALYCLGPAARTQHHLDLAEQIGRQPSFDPDRRRDAADTLARLYEQARYTPDDERLPDADIERARRELCYLAGVSAA